MVGSVKLYLKYLRISIRCQMQYRASFLMVCMINFALSFVDCMGIWVLFARFGGLGQWSVQEALMVFAVTSIAFGLSECIMRGYDRFGRYVISGEFDRTLLRPRSTVLQVMGYNFELNRLGRILQGLLILLFAVASLDLEWSPFKILLLLSAITGGIFLFSGIMVLNATMIFWTGQGLELVNILTYGAVETSQYPIIIYNRWFRRFFTYIIPMACINYFPLVGILGKADPLHSPVWLQYTAPLVGVLFFAAAVQVWNFGVRHYCSAGS